MIPERKYSICYQVYVLQSETKINGEWLKDQILDGLDTLRLCGFNVRGIVSDDHSSNGSAYEMLLENCDEDAGSLLFFDTVHLI